MRGSFWIYLLLVLTVFGLFLFTRHKEALFFRFDPGIKSLYLRSQDIEDREDKIKDRIFLSDGDVYLGAGYLYVLGEDPTAYNFWHPPLVKYLFGFSSVLFGNPFIIQIFLALMFVVLTFFLGFRVTGSVFTAFLAAVFLILDPVFNEVVSQTLLDMGQAAFSLVYFISVVFYPQAFILQGIALGLFASSKFWSTALFFAVVLWGTKAFILREKINYKKVFLSFFVAFLVFCATYAVSFFNAGGLFNIFFWQGKSLMVMLNHSAGSLLGGTFVVFVSGLFKQWWWEGQWARTENWSLLWPVSLLILLGGFLSGKRDKKVFFVYLLPVAYMLYISAQVPFTRYFLVILPYLYLVLADFLVGKAGKNKQRGT